MFFFSNAINLASLRISEKHSVNTSANAKFKGLNVRFMIHTDCCLESATNCLWNCISDAPYAPAGGMTPNDFPFGLNLQSLILRYMYNDNSVEDWQNFESAGLVEKRVIARFLTMLASVRQLGLHNLVAIAIDNLEA